MYTIGTTVANRYLIEAIVAHGGMGTIYRAQDTRLHRVVAFKVLRPDLAADRDACVRFLREGQIAAQMIHPNVVRTYDAGEDQAGPFLVQELLSGQTLDHLIPLPLQRAATIMSEVAAALQYIHGRGYIHCDIKPQNILLKQDGTPVLVDFGIARAEGAAATTLIATPHYLAPERAMGGPPTIAADLYALGIVLYQTIEGHVPFDGSAIPAIIQQHHDRPVPPLQVSGPAIAVLDRVIARLTAKDPAQRYTSADSVRADLAAIARDADHAYPTLPMGSPLNTAAPTPQAARSPQPAVRTPPLPAARTLQATWSTIPAWRKRRWIAGLIGVVLALFVGFTLVRGEQVRVEDIATPTQPALLAPQPVSAEGTDAQNLQPTATTVPVQPADVQVQPRDVQAQPADVQPQPADVHTQPEQPPVAAPPVNVPGDNKQDHDDTRDKGPGKDREKDNKGRGNNRP